MATKEKTKKRRTAGKKVAPIKKAVKKVGAKKMAGDKAVASVKKQVQRKGLSVDTETFPLEGSMARSGEQSGDLQGLSNVQGADSESVEELLQEGNTFEAEAVKGVEDAGDADGAEVRTHEVPQDDVPRGVSGQKVAR